MIRINPHYKKLNASYLFSRIAEIIQEEQQKQPQLSIIKLGIGDVTKALTPAVIQAFHEGVDEMAKDETFQGYGPEQGHEFLREAIATNDFKAHGIDISADEIIISDGSKCDAGNFQELFEQDIRIAIPDPVYPVYVDTNVMAGRTGDFINDRYEGFIYLDATKENNFVPEPPSQTVDLIYLCFPNNPTGETASTAQLAQYVEYARRHNAFILYDAAYVAYITDPSVPKSIFEIPGAKECAVEFRSFSKTAGFTGVRCAYTVIPKECRAFDAHNNPVPVQDLWLRRHTTKFNGVSYPVQKAAAAVHTPQGQQETQERIAYYMQNAHIIRRTMQDIGFTTYGGVNAPFIWIDAQKPSWDLFRELLSKTGVVTTPGAGFGKNGENFIRISAFNHREKVDIAMERLLKTMK